MMPHNDEVCDLMAENGRLAQQIEELREALRFAKPAVDYLLEHFDIAEFECDWENPCGCKVCETTGCLAWKAHLLSKPVSDGE